MIDAFGRGDGEEGWEGGGEDERGGVDALCEVSSCEHSR